MATPHTSYRIRSAYKRLLVLLAKYHGMSATALLHTMIVAKGRAAVKGSGGTDEIRSLVEEIGEGNGGGE